MAGMDVWCRTTVRLLPYGILQYHFCCTISWSWESLDQYNSYLLQIWVLKDQLDVFLSYTEGTVFIGGGTKTWDHGREGPTWLSGKVFDS